MILAFKLMVGTWDLNPEYILLGVHCKSFLVDGQCVFRSTFTNDIRSFHIPLGFL